MNLLYINIGTQTKSQLRKMSFYSGIFIKRLSEVQLLSLFKTRIQTRAYSLRKTASYETC